MNPASTPSKIVSPFAVASQTQEPSRVATPPSIIDVAKQLSGRVHSVMTGKIHCESAIEQLLQLDPENYTKHLIGLPAKPQQTCFVNDDDAMYTLRKPQGSPSLLDALSSFEQQHTEKFLNHKK